MPATSFGLFIKHAWTLSLYTWWEVIWDNKVVFFCFLNSPMGNKPCLKWMFSFCTFKTRLDHITHTHTDSCQCHTFSLYMGFFIVNTTHKALAICMFCQIVYSFTPMMFSYILFHSIIKWILWIYDDFSSKKNQYTLTVNSCTIFFYFLSNLCV